MIRSQSRSLGFFSASLCIFDSPMFVCAVFTAKLVPRELRPTPHHDSERFPARKPSTFQAECTHCFLHIFNDLPIPFGQAGAYSVTLCMCREFCPVERVRSRLLKGSEGRSCTAQRGLETSLRVMSAKQKCAELEHDQYAKKIAHFIHWIAIPSAVPTDRGSGGTCKHRPLHRFDASERRVAVAKKVGAVIARRRTFQHMRRSRTP